MALIQTSNGKSVLRVFRSKNGYKVIKSEKNSSEKVKKKSESRGRL